MQKFWNWIHDDSGGRVLRLEGPIDSESFWGDEITPQDFRDELYAEDGDITLWINSPGGNIKRRRTISTDFKPISSLFRIIFGLLIYSFGVYLTISANIGLAPWDCLGMGIAKHTPLNYGSSMVLIGVCAIVIPLILRERIGFATLFDALITGRLTQFFIDISPYSENHSLWFGTIFMLFGFLFIAFGMYVYMSAEGGCGPNDGLLVAIGKRMPKIPIGVVEMLLWATVTFAGWLLGGTVGIGTVTSVFIGGAVMYLFFDVIGFEPRKLEHKSLTESLAQLFKKV